MGLDMYLYRMKKANVEAGKFYEREALGNNVEVFSITLEDALKEDSVRELAEFLTPIKMEASLLDPKKIEADYGVSIEYVCIKAPTEWGFRCVDREDPLMISTDTLEQKYVYTEIKDFTVVECERLRYWRKDYSLQDQIYNLFPDCGDLNTTYKRIAASDLLALGIEVEETDDSGIFYYEWY